MVPAGRLEALARDLLRLAGGGAGTRRATIAVARWARGAGLRSPRRGGAGIVTAGLTASPELHEPVHRLNGGARQYRHDPASTRRPRRRPGPGPWPSWRRRWGAAP